MWAFLFAVLTAVAGLEGQNGVAEFIEVFKSCGEKVKPTDDEINMIAQGKLKSAESVAMVTCLLKETSVMQSKNFNGTRAVFLISAVIPGEDIQSNMKLFSPIDEACSLATKPQPKETEEEVAVKIYFCLLMEATKLIASASAQVPKE